MRKENIYLIIVILVTIIGGIIFFFSGKSVIENNKKEEKKKIIDCLLAKDVKLYISSNCDYCLKQKEVFGEYFSELNYINCDEGGEWSEVCREAGINDVPTWVFPENTRAVKEKIHSCFECQKKNREISCDDYCYNRSKDDSFLEISGVLDIKDLFEVFGCNNN